MKGTDEIRIYSFDNDGLNELKSFEYGKNWPVVYLIHNNKDLYIGETTSAEVRMSQHLSNNEKNYLEEIAIVFDHKFNKSVILDYEQRLIKYCSVDFKIFLIKIRVNKPYMIIIIVMSIVVILKDYGIV